MAEQHATYHPQDALANTALATVQISAVGAIIAAVQNTLRKQNVGAMGVFTRSGGIIAWYAVGGGSYQFFKDVAGNLREKDDCWNEAIGGFAGGFIVGTAKRSLPFMLGFGAGFGAFMSAYRYTHGLRGWSAQEQSEDDVEQKEAQKKLRRRPLSETIEQLGEGRGIYAPGYEERRRQRLLEKYGVDVKAAQQAS